MTSPRRFGAPDAKNRTVLLDAAEQLMLDEGYAAVTSRAVARKAGLKYQLVYYYFRTMDDLLLEVFTRRAEEGLARQAVALASPNPLRALWEFNTEAAAAALTMEFAALANHRKVIRAALTEYSNRFREAEMTALREFMEKYDAQEKTWPAEVVVVALSGVSRFLMLEESLGVRGGHAETMEFVEQRLRQMDEPSSTTP
ncbi:MULTISPECIES: TetR/AcrR family transcriptional regulator [Nocardia]|uniref:Helix-turn-helix domain-containing protein n=1 Tax=Nocardia aurea TaxID=2144174 RepID=A0ABV3G3C5_9NOCA|nr:MULTISPECIES: TetR/AcrR family transcriptional regulator [Nocardia]